MLMFSPNLIIVLLTILFVDTARNCVSEAFVTLQYSIARISPCNSLTPSGLAFHPRKVEDSDFHTPEDRIREAYREWCKYYGRSYDEKRLRTFAANFVAVEKYHLQTKVSLVLNEFAELTEREYSKHLETAARVAIPEKIGPRANDDSNSFFQERRDVDESNNDPVTSYLDPYPSPISYSHVEELKPPIPRSQTQIIQSNNKNADSGISSDTTDPLDESSSTNEVLAALQSTVASLSTMVQSLATAPQSVAQQQPTAQPLDSLVIDLLQQQDGSISQLEESVEGLHEIQKQSSDLIELVSNNQKQMTEMMEAVQSEVVALQQDQKQVEGNHASLLNRIKELEAAVAKFDWCDPVLERSLVPSPETATKQRIELQPNIQPFGLVQRCVFP